MCFDCYDKNEYQIRVDISWQDRHAMLKTRKWHVEGAYLSFSYMVGMKVVRIHPTELPRPNTTINSIALDYLITVKDARQPELQFWRYWLYHVDSGEFEAVLGAMRNGGYGKVPSWRSKFEYDWALGVLLGM